jgi:hypothetical protein
MPRIGQELGRGAEGVVYEDLDQPGWVVKEFHPGGTSPYQSGNEFQNLERARAIRPDNVVKAQAPSHPRQGFLVKEQVLRRMCRRIWPRKLRCFKTSFLRSPMPEVT